MIAGTCSSCRCSQSPARPATGSPTSSPEAQVYAATIREVVRHQPPPADDPDALPVVYVVAVGETTIAADVQAEVATELHDEVDVQFADERDEAVDEDVENAPVLDDGVLIAVGELRPDRGPGVDGGRGLPLRAGCVEGGLQLRRRLVELVVTSSSLLPES